MWRQQCQPCSFHLCPRCCRHLSTALLWASSRAAQTCSQVWHGDTGMGQGDFKITVLNQPTLRGDLAQPWFLPAPWGESLLLFHRIAVRPWFGDVPACSVALRRWMEAGSVPVGQPAEQMPLVVKSKTKLSQIFPFFTHIFVPPPPPPLCWA